MFHVHRWDRSSNFVQVPELMYKRRAQYEGNMTKFFQVSVPRRKLEIFPSPRNTKKYEGVGRSMKVFWRIYEESWGNMERLWRKYEEIWRNMNKYEENIKKYVGKMKIRTAPIYGPWHLENSELILLSRGGGAWFEISRIEASQRERHETLWKSFVPSF